MSLAEVGALISERDRIDSRRATGPMCVAPDAAVIDSTSLGVEEVVELIMQKIGTGRC
jgi:cytidylate kinase